MCVGLLVYSISVVSIYALGACCSASLLPLSFSVCLCVDLPHELEEFLSNIVGVVLVAWPPSVISHLVCPKLCACVHLSVIIAS